MDFERTYDDWEKEAPKLTASGRKNPFIVPENYFKSLTDNIESAIAAENLKSVIPNDGFVTPEGYFSDLGEKIRNKTSKSSYKPAIRVLKTAWIKYAAAACITVATGITLYINMHSNPIQKEMHSIPEQDIVQYLQLNTDAGDTRFIMDNINLEQSFSDLGTDMSKDELEDYINSTTL